MTAAAAEAGYSGTPLAKKLGLADGQRVLFLDLPDSLRSLAQSRDFAAAEHGGWAVLPKSGKLDLVMGFTRSRAVLENATPWLRAAIAPTGTIWICWPKKASKIATDVDENVLRELLLPTGLVDVKVAAIDAVWSGLKFVVRRELRR